MASEPSASTPLTAEQAAIASLWGRTEDLNAIWSVAAQLAGHGPEVMYATEHRTGNEWELTVAKFRHAEITLTGEVNVSVFLHRAQEFKVLALKRSSLGARQIVRLSEAKVSGRLRITFRLAESYFRYSAPDRGALRYEWAGAASYAFYDPTYTATPAGYAEHYDQQKKIDLALLQPNPHPLCQALYIYTHVSVSLKDVIYLASTTVRNYEEIVAGALPELAQDDRVLTALFGPAHFPEVAQGKAPEVAAWFAGLVTPPGSVSLTGGKTEVDGWHGFYSASPKDVLREPVSPAKSAQYTVTPIARVFAAGAQKERLGFVGDALPDATWTSTGEAGGRIEKTGNDHFYVPSGGLSPSAAFNTDGETLIPAAYRSSVPGLPASTDVIRAANAGDSASAFFVTTVVSPTHFIRFSEHPDGMRMSSCYIDKHQQEKEVPADKVRWHILAGNGVVSAQGVFNQAVTSPSPVTILMAEDLRSEEEWRFAVTIVPLPLLTVRDVVRVQQE